eukprot:scaffold7396_cov127-Skeletonema_menzelii.AAC.12
MSEDDPSSAGETAGLVSQQKSTSSTESGHRAYIHLNDNQHRSSPLAFNIDKYYAFDASSSSLWSKNNGCVAPLSSCCHSSML